MNEHGIWIAQMVCPARHAIVSITFDPAKIGPKRATAAFYAQIYAAIESGELEPACPVCRAAFGTWTCHTGQTAWATADLARAVAQQRPGTN